VGAKKRREKSGPGNCTLIFWDFLKIFRDWHAPRSRRIILPPKSNIFRSAVPGWLPGTALHFLASGAGRGGRIGRKASGGQRALPFGIPSPGDAPKGLTAARDPVSRTVAKDLYRPASGTRCKPGSRPRPSPSDHFFSLPRSDKHTKIIDKN